MRHYRLTCYMFCLLSFFSVPLFAATSSTQLTSWSTEPFYQYFSAAQLNAGRQNWEVDFDSQGRVIVNNQHALLIYDGVRWQQLPLSSKDRIRAMKVAWDDRIYIGGIYTFGYYQATPLGTWEYVDLTLKLPEDQQKKFGAVGSIELHDNQIYAAHDRGYFKASREDEVESVYPGHMHLLGVAQDLIWISNQYQLTLYPSQAEPIVIDDENIGRNPVSAIFPVADGYLIIQTEGFIYQWQPDHQALINIEGLSGATIRKASLIPDGLAVSTYDRGLFILDKQGEVIYQFQHQADWVTDAAYQDGNLWLTTNNGVLRLPWPITLSRFTEQQGIRGEVNSVSQFNDTVYAATNLGLLAWQPQQQQFKPINLSAGNTASISTEVWQQAVSKAGLLNSSPRGVFLFNDEQTPTEWLATSGNRTFIPMEQWPEHFLIIAGRSGLRLLDMSSGKPEVVMRDKDISSYPYYYAHDSQNRIFFGSILNTIGVYLFDENKQAELKYFGANFIAKGSNEYRMYLTEMDGDVFVLNKLRVCRFELQEDLTCVDDPRIDQRFRNTQLLETIGDNLFLVGQQQLTYLAERDEQGHLQPIPSILDELPHALTHNILILPGGSLLLAREDGLWQLDPTKLKPRAKPVASVQQVYSGTHQFYAGAKPLTDYPHTIPVEQNSLRFLFGSQTFTEASYFQWRSKLEGFEQEWTEWRNEPWRDITQLPGGQYRLQIQMQDNAGQSSEVSTFSFEVASPWYLTRNALIAWFLMILLLLLSSGYAFSHWRTRALRTKQQELNEAIAQKTAELQKQTEQLKEQAHQLTLLDEAKSRFFANITHEFRTPLTLTIGPIQDILNGRFGMVNESISNALTLARKRSEQLLQLVEEMLDIARLDAGVLPLHGQSINVQNLVKEILAQLDSMAEAKKIALSSSFNGIEMQLVADRKQLSKVLINLLGNAIKFTPENGKVEVVVDCLDDSINIIINDTGPGLTNDQIAQIFERFKQVNTDKHKALGGVGLGLSLAKEIAEMHQGSIEVSSVPGQGASFTLHLPRENHITVAQQELQKPQTDDALQPIFVEAHHEDTTTNEMPLILIVEDDKDLQGYIAGHLSEHYRVEVSNNGEAGLLKARALTPDLIISDVMMPVMDGMELCQHLKADAETDFIPVILLTARVDDKDRISGYEHGADDYLTKPFDATVLLSRVANLLIASGRWRARLEKAGLQLAVTPGLQDKDKRFADTFTAMLTARMPDSEFNVEQMATAMNMERTTLYKRVQLVFGKTPSELLINSRLNAAAQLLAENKGSVSEIAYAVGYNSVAHFTQSFKKQFQQTPSAYRRESQN